jgi:hypothetical protein
MTVVCEDGTEHTIERLALRDLNRKIRSLNPSLQTGYANNLRGLLRVHRKISVLHLKYVANTSIRTTI